MKCSGQPITINQSVLRLFTHDPFPVFHPDPIDAPQVGMPGVVAFFLIQVEEYDDDPGKSVASPKMLTSENKGLRNAFRQAVLR
jgi:hypothetical protein